MQSIVDIRNMNSLDDNDWSINYHNCYNRRLPTHTFLHWLTSIYSQYLTRLGVLAFLRSAHSLPNLVSTNVFTDEISLRFIWNVKNQALQITSYIVVLFIILSFILQYKINTSAIAFTTRVENVIRLSSFDSNDLTTWIDSSQSISGTNYQ